MTVPFNLERLVRPNILAMKPYSSARDEFIREAQDYVFLDANENPYGDGLNRYPDPKQRNVKAELAVLTELSESNVLLGNGSDEVLDLLFRAFCRPGIDNVITLPPTYGMYGVLANTNDVMIREVLLTEEFQPDVPEILKNADDHTKMIFLCSPNNPTGNLMSTEKIERILENFNGLVVIDEAYAQFTDSDSWLKRLKDYPNLVVTQTFSKAYGLAGIRLGICYASEEIIRILDKIKPPYNVNELTQKAAIEALQNRDSRVITIESIIDNKNHLIKALLEVNYVSKLFPSDANFVLIKVDDAPLRYQQLLKAGVVTRNRSSQPLCENTLRITVGTTEENIRLIKALNSINS